MTKQIFLLILITVAVTSPTVTKRSLSTASLQIESVFLNNRLGLLSEEKRIRQTFWWGMLILFKNLATWRTYHNICVFLFYFLFLIVVISTYIFVLMEYVIKVLWTYYFSQVLRDIAWGYVFVVFNWRNIHTFILFHLVLLVFRFVALLFALIILLLNVCVLV